MDDGDRVTKPMLELVEPGRGVAAPPAILTLSGVARHFGALKAVDGIDLDVRDGEFLTVVGPSGCGQDHAPAHARRPRDAVRRRDRAPRPVDHRPAAEPRAPPASSSSRWRCSRTARVGENIELPAEGQGRPARRPPIPRARADAPDAPARSLPRPQRHALLRRRAPARGARPRLRLRPRDPLLRRAAVGDRLQAEEDAREGAEGHPQGDRQDLRLHHPQPRGGDGDVRPHRR